MNARGAGAAPSSAACRAGTLEEAVVADPEYWIAHKFLAAVYLKEHEFEKNRVHNARLQLQKARARALP